jgi:FtsH-binding integral membrane protein
MYAFTWMESVAVAELTADLEVEGVLISMLALVLCTGCLFVSALFTKITARLVCNLIIGILVACVLQLIFMIVLLVMGLNSWEVALCAVFGILITGGYILIDLLQIMTPDVISHDDYILGAINLYIDLVRMFIYILALLAKKK